VSDRPTDDKAEELQELDAPQADPGETASLSSDLSDINPDDEASFSDEAGPEEYEDEEILPVEFLEDPETFSSVFPRGDLYDDDRLTNETVIMSPSEVRRMAGRSASSRRAPGAPSSVTGTRRSRREEEANLTPEELAIRRRHDRHAKILLYGIIALVTLAFAGLLTYKLPGIFPNTFPDGIWPWNKILSAYTGEGY